MQTVSIRNAERNDFDDILSMNLAEVQHTSPMDMERLITLDALSCFHKIAGAKNRVSAFLLAMCNGAAYANSNFEWFSQRYPRFIYVDRIVVTPESKGQRLGTLLYEEIFRYARHHEIPLVTCEYNVIPPNEPSRLFHDKFGFKEQETQWAADGTKKVSLQAAET